MKQAKNIAGSIREGNEEKTVSRSWLAAGTPKFFILDGEKKNVKYLRGGIILFDDGSSATYERTKEATENDMLSMIDITYQVKKN